MKDIQHGPSDNPSMVVGFNPEAVRAFKSEDDFVKDGVKAGHYEGHPKQDEMLRFVYQKAQPKQTEQAPAPKTTPKSGEKSTEQA